MKPYAVFEAKQSINAEQIAYAQKKVSTVRGLHRTSLPIPHAGGTYKPKPLIPILGGILTFESDWKPELGKAFKVALKNDEADGKLDLGCIAAHGSFNFSTDAGHYEIHLGKKPATTFLFNLISQLQFSGTVPMIDVQAYARWLTE